MATPSGVCPMAGCTSLQSNAVHFPSPHPSLLTMATLDWSVECGRGLACDSDDGVVTTPQCSTGTAPPGSSGGATVYTVCTLDNTATKEETGNMNYRSTNSTGYVVDTANHDGDEYTTIVYYRSLDVSVSRNWTKSSEWYHPTPALPLLVPTTDLIVVTDGHVVSGLTTAGQFQDPERTIETEEASSPLPTENGVMVFTSPSGIISSYLLNGIPHASLILNDSIVNNRTHLSCEGVWQPTNGAAAAIDFENNRLYTVTSFAPNSPASASCSHMTLPPLRLYAIDVSRTLNNRLYVAWYHDVNITNEQRAAADFETETKDNFQVAVVNNDGSEDNVSVIIAKGNTGNVGSASKAKTMMRSYLDADTHATENWTTNLVPGAYISRVAYDGEHLHVLTNVGVTSLDASSGTITGHHSIPDRPDSGLFRAVTRMSANSDSVLFFIDSLVHDFDNDKSNASSKPSARLGVYNASDFSLLNTYNLPFACGASSSLSPWSSGISMNMVDDEYDQDYILDDNFAEGFVVACPGVILGFRSPAS